MKNHSCDACDKSFNSADALAMHNKAKHAGAYKDPLLSARQKKKIRNGAIVIISVIVLFFAFKAFGEANGPAVINVEVDEQKAQEISPGAVHWHPKVEIIIDGKRTPIPPDIGYGTGKIIDTHLSGMRMSPTHTHESDGTIHVENKNPRSKQETLTLGYFFYVWGKTFNSRCVFEYCTDKGTLTMTVNGKENTEFERYMMQDNDQIRITYESG